MSDEEFDEDDMAAAIAAEQAEKAAGGDDDDFDEDDMAAAIAAEQAEKAGGGDDGELELDDMDMAAAIAAEQAERTGGDGGGTPGASAEPETLGGAIAARLDERPGAIQDIVVDLTAVLGTAEMKVSNLLKIGRGAVIELDRRVGDTVDIRVSGQPIARGEVVVVEDHLAVSITDLVKKN